MESIQFLKASKNGRGEWALAGPRARCSSMCVAHLPDQLIYSLLVDFNIFLFVCFIANWVRTTLRLLWCVKLYTFMMESSLTPPHFFLWAKIAAYCISKGRNRMKLLAHVRGSRWDGHHHKLLSCVAAVTSPSCNRTVTISFSVHMLIVSTATRQCWDMGDHGIDAPW